MMLTRLAFLSNNFTFVSGRQKQWRLEPYVQCGWSKARFHSFFVCPCTTVVKSMGTQSTRYLYCEVCRVFNPTSFKTTVLYNGSVKDKSLKQCFNQRKNALNLRNNVCVFFFNFFLKYAVLMYHHSVSICRDLLFDEVVIENTQSDDILKWQSDPDRFLGFDWVYSQEEKLKLIMRCNHMDYYDNPDASYCFWARII